MERRYVFLKRLCQVLCALGGQLCSLVVSYFGLIWPHINLGPDTICKITEACLCISHILLSQQGSDVEVKVPANLSKYMEALLAFTTHSSQVRDPFWVHFLQAVISTSNYKNCVWISCVWAPVNFCLCSFWSHPLRLLGDAYSDMRLCQRTRLLWRWPSNTSERLWPT